MHRLRRLLVLAGAAVFAFGGPLTAGAQTLEDAREHTTQLRTQFDELTLRYESVLVAVEDAAVELERLERREADLEAAHAQLDDRLGSRARSVYKHGSTGALDALLGGDAVAEGMERASMFVTVQRRDRTELEEVVASRDALDQVRALAVAQRRRLAELEVELAEARETLEDELWQAELVAQSIEDRDARQRELSQGNQHGVYACPLPPDRTHFIDSWGFSRSGGRGHRGTDLMGPMDAPVYAFTDGVIERRANSRLGGLSLYLRGDDGSTYFYAHLNGYTDLGRQGVRVEAGDHIAFNGNSGNARGGSPHVHFERHPGGGAAVNPYPWLARACF